MKFATALGFLGLLGLAVLVIIYLLKPNYQQKTISSSYVWKLSLKYRKKRITVNRLRNLLIIFCQVLIIFSCALILTQPFKQAEAQENKAEKIMIIDASANMLTRTRNDEDKYSGPARFIKAVDLVKAQGLQALTQEQGRVTVILAGEKARIVTQAILIEEFETVMEGLAEDEDGVPKACTYGTADIDGAMLLAEGILDENPAAEVIFYTVTKYVTTGRVEVIYVTDFDKPEWNAAILNVTPISDGYWDPEKEEWIDENYFAFEAEVASYGRDWALKVYFNADGVNYEQKTVSAEITETCRNGQRSTIRFEGLQIYSYRSVHIWIEVEDSFEYDNSFWVCGGTKETLTVQYVSTAPKGVSPAGSRYHNPFFENVLLAVTSILRPRWNIVVNKAVVNPQGNFEPNGSDFYIFEHQLPQTLPEDGAVMVVNPAGSNFIPENLGLTFGDIHGVTAGMTDFILSAAQQHPVLNNINPADITASQYISVNSQNGAYNGYQPLMYFGTAEGDPALLVKNDAGTKIAVLPFSLHSSNMPVVLDWPVLMLNIFNYFLPSTITRYVYDVGETVSINSRSTFIELEGEGIKEKIESFPYQVSVPVNGKYTLTQRLMSGKIAADDFFVKIADSQSDFSHVEAELKNPAFPLPSSAVRWDIVIYFASTLFALLFIERLLHIRTEGL